MEVVEVVLVGTGGDAGWPEPGCRCASCASARAAGRTRAPAAVRLDGHPLGPGLGRPGDCLHVGPHRVRLHTAARPGRLCYAVTGADGVRLLYAPSGVDLGPYADPVAIDPAAGDAYEVVLLGPDRDGLRSVAHGLAALRERGAVTAETDVVVVGLSHHDPPASELGRLLTAWGARTVPDGTAVQVRVRTPGLVPDHADSSDPANTPRSGLWGRTLVLGGARSGKSAYAEDLLRAEPHVTYLATGGARTQDAEWVDRVAAHRRRRPYGWTTVESLDAAAVLASACHPVLVDCLGTWLTGCMDQYGAWDDPRARPAVHAELARLVATWRALRVPVVAVSNEVGSGVVPATASGRLFRDLLGRLNAQIAAQSETVLLTVAGLTVPLRGHDVLGPR